MVRRDSLEAQLARLLGRSPQKRLAFDFTADQHGPIGRRLAAVLDVLVGELDHPTQISRNPHAAMHLEGLVLDALLLGRPHTHSEAMSRPVPAGVGTTVRRAVDLLEQRPHEPWTAAALAAEVHLSVRALQEGFRRDLDTTPMTYLHEVRLRRARDALQAADSTVTTVGAVAVGLGLLHRGRFAAAYRAAFGESPSETLHSSV